MVPDRSSEVQLNDLHSQRRRIGAEIDRAISRVLDHGSFIMGPEIQALEEKLAVLAGDRIAVTCSSGTDALVMALLALGVSPGDAVLLPSFTFAATASSVAMLGALPVFVDVSDETLNIDPDDLALTAQWATDAGFDCKAVIAVDLFGHPADYARLLPVAEAHGFTVVADAAQSFGATSRDGQVGALAPITTTSFFPAKPLGCYGDGGAVFTDSKETARDLRSIRVHGQGTNKYDNVRVGLNARMDSLQAAILLEKLEIFESELQSRRLIASRYDAALSGRVVTPRTVEGSAPSWAQYTIRLPDRDNTAARLDRMGIPTAVYYPRPLHLQPAFESAPRSPSGLQISEKLSREVLSLPMHPYLTEEAQQRVIDGLLSSE